MERYVLKNRVDIKHNIKQNFSPLLHTLEMLVSIFLNLEKSNFINYVSLSIKFSIFS